MRVMGWISAVVLAVGSLVYAGAVLVAVKFGGFLVFLFVNDDRTTKSSAFRLYFEILFSECRLPLILATLLLLFLFGTRTSSPSRKSAQRIEESFAAIEAKESAERTPDEEV